MTYQRSFWCKPKYKKTQYELDSFDLPIFVAVFVPVYCRKSPCHCVAAVSDYYPYCLVDLVWIDPLIDESVIEPFTVVFKRIRFPVLIVTAVGTFLIPLFMKCEILLELLM